MSDPAGSTGIAQRLLEPDALVLAAHRVQEQTDEGAVEHEVDDRGGGEHVGAEHREEHDHLEHRARDRDRVAPPLLVRDPEAADAERHHDEQPGEHRRGDRPEDEPEDGVDVAEERRDDERLGLEMIDPLPLVHVAILADGEGTRGIASRVRSWPHAAAMSAPRLRRTVAATPWDLRVLANARSGPARLASPA